MPVLLLYANGLPVVHLRQQRLLFEIRRGKPYHQDRVYQRSQEQPYVTFSPLAHRYMHLRSWSRGQSKECYVYAGLQSASFNMRS